MGTKVERRLDDKKMKWFNRWDEGNVLLCLCYHKIFTHLRQFHKSHSKASSTCI